MPNSASIAAYSIDLEHITTLAGILNTTANNVGTVNTLMENQLVYNLATEITGVDISNNTSSNIYTSQQTNTPFFANEIEATVRSKFDVVTSPNLTDGNFALSAQYVDSNQVYDSVNNLIGNGITKDISVIAPTLSIYDSFVSVTSTDNNGPFSDQSGNYVVTFDASNSNSNIIRALNSRYSTTDNSDPLQAKEYVDFNQQYSCGQDINKFFVLNQNTGEPLPRDLSAQFQATANAFTVTCVPEAATSSNDFGTYKIEQTQSTSKVSIELDNVPENNNLDLKLNKIKHFPVFNSTLGLDGSNNLPSEMTYEEYITAFDTNTEPWSIVSGNKVEMIIQETPGSGYFLRDASNNINSNILTDENETITLDSTNLSDNYRYMKDYVAGSHRIDFSGETLYIDNGINGSSLNNSENLFVLSNGREGLVEGVFQDHGQIRLDINSVYSRVVENQNSSSDLSNLLAARVIYNSEDGVNGRQGIQNDLKTNSYVQYVNKLVVKKPVNDVNYAVSNGASINLFNGTSIVNSLFGDYIEFVNEASVDDNMLEIFKINTHQVFITEETNALIANATDSDPEIVIPNFNVSGIVTNFNSLVTTQTLDRMQINIALKPLSELSIYTDASNSGWQIKNYYQPANNVTKVSLNTVSSSNISSQPPRQLYDEGNGRPITFPTKWPNIWKDTQYYNGNVNGSNEVSYMLNNPGAALNYSIALIPVPQNGVLSPIFAYNLSIIWGINTTAYTNKIRYETPPATIFNQSIESVEIVNSSTYQYINTNANTENNAIVGSNIVLVKTTYTTEIQLEVPLNLLPYEGLMAKTPRFSVKYIAYKLQYTNANGKTVANIDNLAYVVGVGNTINYTKVQYIVNQQNSNTPLVFTGTLSSDDFKELDINVAAINSDDSMVQISDPGKANAFYGNPVILNLLQQYDKNPLQYDIVINLGGTSTTPLINETGYKVRIVVQPEVSYDVQHFEYAIENLGDVINNNTLSVVNGYSNIINEWDSTSYSITTDTDEYGTTVLTIIDSETDEQVATITTPDWKYLNTQAFITLCNNDVWKIHKYIGVSVSENTPTSFFAPINYQVVQGSNTFNNTFSPDAGVYVVGNGSSLSVSTISEVGYVYDFTLKQDYISVNLVGDASAQLSPITDFTYQYVNGSSFSKILTLQRYRGYYGAQGNVQVYTIVRPQLTATFSVTTQTAVVSQTFNVYKDKTVTVNNLRNQSNVSIGGIGLKITFFESMLASGDIDSFDVYTLGDSVNIVLENANYQDFVPVNLSFTLAQYGLYAFSGQNYDSTNGPLKINASRLKIKNTAFPHAKAEYSIYMGFAEGSIRFLPNYLGNPHSANWSNSQLLFSAEYADWLLSNNGGYGYDTSNNPQNRAIQFVRTPNVQYSTSISYVVIAPPYLKFTQYGNFTQETDLPYDPSDNASANIVYRYLPLRIENDIYKPFETRAVMYSDAVTQITVTSDSTKTNNASFRYINNKSIGGYVISPNNEPSKIIVNGNYYNIKMYLGLKNSSSPQLLVTLFNDESNKLLNLPVEIIGSQQPNSGNLSLITSINNNSGAVISFMQKHVTYNNGITLEDIFADTNVDPNNIRLKIDSFFLKINNNSKNLDLEILQGINVSLYTRKLEMNQSGNMSIKVYKYLPLFNGINQTSQVTTIVYNSREVKTISVPNISLTANTVPNWNTLLSSISYNTVSNSQWVTDLSFNATNTTTFVSVVNLTVDSAFVIQPLLLACETNGIKKITLVNKEPLMRIVNKIGMPIMEIDGNGVVKTSTVSTNSLLINPIPGESINSSISNYPLYSILGNSIDNVL
jgi:hypothetical protein